MRVVVADDAVLLREGLARLLAEAGFEVVGLAADADELLAELDDGWLRDQVRGLHTCAAFMAGAPGSYADEVEGCYGVRPTHTDEAVFTAAHDRLEELLPGDGPLAERYARWRRASTSSPRPAPASARASDTSCPRSSRAGESWSRPRRRRSRSSC